LSTASHPAARLGEHVQLLAQRIEADFEVFQNRIA
jgi:hypothetical protein